MNTTTWLFVDYLPCSFLHLAPYGFGQTKLDMILEARVIATYLFPEVIRYNNRDVNVGITQYKLNPKEEGDYTRFSMNEGENLFEKVWKKMFLLTHL